jgi:hypothetical protein
MYEIANEKITGKGLSVGARVFLGIISALFGFMMIISAEESKFPFAIYLFGAFCFLVMLTCVTSGRVRQFIGSVIGTVIVGLAVWYLCSEISDGPVISDRRSVPSIFNAILFCVFFGVPSAAYVIKAKFGFRPKQP